MLDEDCYAIVMLLDWVVGVNLIVLSGQGLVREGSDRDYLDRLVQIDNDSSYYSFLCALCAVGSCIFNSRSK